MADTHIVYGTEGNEIARFWSDSSLVMGQYGPSGTIGTSNVRSILQEGEQEDGPNILQLHYSTWDLLEQKIRSYRQQEDEALLEALELIQVGDENGPIDAIHVYGWAYGGEGIYINEDTDWGKRTIKNLQGYPVLNDDDHNEIEEELWDEALERLDFRDAGAPEWLQEAADCAVGGDATNPFNAIQRVANEMLNEAANEVRMSGHAHIEGNDFYIPREALKKEFAELDLEPVAQSVAQAAATLAAQLVDEGGMSKKKASTLRQLIEGLGADPDEIPKPEGSWVETYPDVWSYLPGQLLGHFGEGFDDTVRRGFAKILRPVAPFAADEIESPEHLHKNPAGRRHRRHRR